MSHWVIVPVLLPLLTGILLLLLRGSNPLPHRLISLASSVLLVATAIIVLLQVADGGVQVYRLGDWAAPFGIVLAADLLSVAMVLITAALATGVLLHGWRSAHTGARFYVLFQMQLFGLNGAFLTGDLFNLFVFFEVLLIASYGLLLLDGGADRTRAGLHYVVLNLIGSTLFLFAVGALYGVLGTLNMADMATRLARLPEADLGVVRTAALLLFAVFALKAALAPLHLGLPGAYAHTSAAVAAMFAIMTKVGAYSILRVYSLLFGTHSGPAAGLLDAWLVPLALLTVAAGAVGVLASRRLSEQAAYLVVMSAGTLLTAFGLGGVQAIAAGIYYLAHTTFAAAALFLLADILARARGAHADQLCTGPELPRGQLLAGLFLFCAIAITGLPPLSGFVGKWLILQSSIGHTWMTWVFATLLITSLLGVMGLARSGSLLFFDTDAMLRPGPSVRAFDLRALVLLLLLGIALVVLAGPVYEFGEAAAAQLLAPGAYIDAVLQATSKGGAS